LNSNAAHRAGLLALPTDRELRQQIVSVEAELNRMGKVQNRMQAGHAAPRHPTFSNL
jgi:hypothetical protein